MANHDKLYKGNQLIETFFQPLAQLYCSHFEIRLINFDFLLYVVKIGIKLDAQSQQL